MFFHLNQISKGDTLIQVNKISEYDISEKKKIGVNLLQNIGVKKQFKKHNALMLQELWYQVNLPYELWQLSLTEYVF